MQQYWQRNFERSERLINHGIGTEAFFRTIEQELPPVVSRAELAKATGGLISAKTLSNEDALHKGPAERVRHDLLNEPQRRLLRQRAHGKLLGIFEKRTRAP